MMLRRVRWLLGVLLVVSCAGVYLLSFYSLRNSLLEATTSQAQTQAWRMHAFRQRDGLKQAEDEAADLAAGDNEIGRVDGGFRRVDELTNREADTQSEHDERHVPQRTPAPSFESHSNNNNNGAGGDQVDMWPKGGGGVAASNEVEELCYAHRDFGVVDEIAGTAATYCTEAASDVEAASTFTRYYSLTTKVTATAVSNFIVDMRLAVINKPIDDISQDGGQHDPRFRFMSVKPYCFCAGKQDAAALTDVDYRMMWWNVFSRYVPNVIDSVCTSIKSEQDVPNHEAPSGEIKWTRIQRKAIVIPRKHDHNPFFQIGVVLNALVMMKVLGWSTADTQLVHLDAGFPNAMDAIQKDMLSPNFPILEGRDLMGTVVRFDQALFVPFEMTGPMMRHLNDEEPCGHNAMITQFRDTIMQRLHVPQQKKDPTSCTVTIISRRPYSGRMISRKWLTEDEILRRMREEYEQPGVYKHGVCKIQSVDFIDLTMEEQMAVIVESDMVIGMHGAGMVNVMWTRPGTKVIEIFPLSRKRWGYRNLCKYVGCDWQEFRGGKDTGKGGNSSDKTIEYSEWHPFFDPIFKAMVQQLEGAASERFLETEVDHHEDDTR